MSLQFPQSYESETVVGTFIIEEYAGKKYKMLFVEEIRDEPIIEDPDIIDGVVDLLGLHGQDLSTDRHDARQLIDYAIAQENDANSIVGPFKYYWHYNSKSNRVIENAFKIADHTHIPMESADSKQIIEKVVERLGVDIFRIASGVSKV